MKLGALALLPFAVAGVAATPSMPTKFDLLCVGLEEGVDVNGRYKAGANKPRDLHFRIDTEGRKWCAAHCPVTFGVEKQGDQMHLLGSSASRPRVYIIDPSSEIVTMISALPARSSEVSVFRYYRCSPAEFSGFPS